MHLVRLLVRFRLRSMWNTAWRSPRGKSLRLVWLFVLATPVAYTGLLWTALDTIAAVAGRAVQGAALAAVCGAIVTASVFGKMASNDAVVAGSGENEFFLTKPIALSNLVLARSLAGAATDFFDALFLVPALVAGALGWNLGAPGVGMAVATSVAVQIAVSAVAQAGQIIVVRLVKPRRRRTAWALSATLAALAMAGLWMVATWVLRQPVAAVDHLMPWTGVIARSPAWAIVAPLVALSAGGAGAGLLALGAVVSLSVVATALAMFAVALAARGGWEQAGAPWAEAARAVAAGTRRRSIGPFGKDWRHLTRDRSRLLRLIAMPLVFVGVQVFGSAGWGWSTADAHHVGLVAFSLAAYAATFGPLAHMEAERRAFWILRSAPTPLGRLMAARALFWSLVIGGMGGVTFLGLGLAGDVAASPETLLLGGLVLLGAVAISWLAVAMACGAADFTDEARSTLSPSVVYLYLLVAGLYNVVLTDTGVSRWRGVALYLLATGLYWSTGIRRAADAFDPDSQVDRRQRLMTPGAGASLAILLFLGHRAALNVPRTTATPEAAVWVDLAFLALVGVCAALYVARRPRDKARMGWWPALGLAVGAALGATALLRLSGGQDVSSDWHGPSPVMSIVFGVLTVTVEEVVFRGIIQRALADDGYGRVLAFVGATLLSVAAGRGEASLAFVITHVVAGLVRAGTGRLSAAWLTRLAIVGVAAALVRVGS